MPRSVKVVEVILERIPFECIKKHPPENVKNVLQTLPERLANNDEIPSSVLEGNLESHLFRSANTAVKRNANVMKRRIPAASNPCRLWCASVRRRVSLTDTPHTSFGLYACVPAGLHILCQEAAIGQAMFQPLGETEAPMY